MQLDFFPEHPHHSAVLRKKMAAPEDSSKSTDIGENSASTGDRLQFLGEFSQRMKDTEQRQSCSEELQTVVSWVENCSTLTAPFDEEKHELKLCVESLRCLRNACAGSRQNQGLLLSSSVPALLSRFINDTVQTEAPSEDVLALLRCSIQVAVNMITDNSHGQLSIWPVLYPTTFVTVLNCHDTKSRHYCCMLLLACLKSPEAMKMFLSSEGRKVVMEAVLSICMLETELDFSLQLVNYLLQNDNFIADSLASLSTEARIILAEILSAHLSEELEDSSAPSSISEGGLNAVAETFEKCCHNVVKFATGDEQDESDHKVPILVIKLLTALCLATSSPSMPALAILQGRKALLISSLELLHMVHAAGKKGDNLFTVTQSLGMEEASRNPVHGFRRDLVRLIGNLSYRCKENQDMVRDLKGIHIILEQCNIDDHNPFIEQWAILAIRNLCENNLENQDVIAGLRQQGVATNETLQSLGYEADMRDDGKVYLKNVKKR